MSTEIKTMRIDALLIKLYTRPICRFLRRRGARVTYPRFRELVSASVARILSEHPDLDWAEARRRAAEATGATAPLQLFPKPADGGTPVAEKPAPVRTMSNAKKTSAKKTTANKTRAKKKTTAARKHTAKKKKTTTRAATSRRKAA